MVVAKALALMGVLRAGMDSVIVCIGKYMNLVAPITLVIPYGTTYYPHYRPIKAFRLVVGLRVVGDCELVLNLHHHTKPVEESYPNWLPLSYTTVPAAPYSNTHSSYKSRATVNASMFLDYTACVSFVKQSVMTRRNLRPLLNLQRGPKSSASIETGVSLVGNSCIGLVRLRNFSQVQAKGVHLLIVDETSAAMFGQ